MKNIRKIAPIVFLLLIIQIFPIVLTSASSPIINFTDVHGIDTTYYIIYGSVYVTGDGYDPDTNYSIALVNIPLVEGDPIPDPMPDTVVEILSDETGAVPLTNIWNQWNVTDNHYLPIGVYTIVVDVNGDGVYNEGVDVTDKMTIRYAAGVSRPEPEEIPTFAAPEIPFGTIMIVLTLLAAFSLYKRGVNISPIKY